MVHNAEYRLESRMITHTERWATAANERSDHTTAIVILHSRAGDERESLALLTELTPTTGTSGFCHLRHSI